LPHKHLPKSHYLYDVWPAHEMPKADCDRMWTQYLHGHEGRECVKDVKPGNKIATCILKSADKEHVNADEQARRDAVFEAFSNAEARRYAALIAAEGVK
jgi:hypothetical protein